MAETILPDVYIEVRAEGLIAPAQITVGRMGIVGTANRGPLLDPQILSSAQDARRVFGEPDAVATTDALTLVRAIELAYAGGATTVFGVRVSGRDSTPAKKPTAVAATRALAAAGSGTCATLTAKTPGTWGNKLTVEVTAATQAPFVRDEVHDVQSDGEAISLSHAPVDLTAKRNRIRLTRKATGATTDLEIVTGTPTAKQVKLDKDTGALTFVPPLAAGDQVTASYVVPSDGASDVNLAYGEAKESYTVLSGKDLAAQVNAPGGSDLVTAKAAADPDGNKKPAAAPEALFAGGTDGSAGAIYTEGLEALLSEDAHIIVAAGQPASAVGADLAAHCANASTDAIKRDRIAVVGSALGDGTDDIQATLDTLGSDRLIFVAPGIVARDNAADPPADVTLPGAYAAAAVGGLIAGLSAHVSPTNKVVGGASRLETVFNSGELAQLVSERALVLTERQGIRVVKGITTATNTAFSQITTRRIVDYAKYGVRSAANPYIGLLNNTRVRGALRATINSFLAQMVLDEMLVGYDLDVTATRDEERQGIARVTMTLRPTFSIDYIKVTMFLE